MVYPNERTDGFTGPLPPVNAGREWLTKLRLDAATDITNRLAPYYDGDPVDIHEEVRESLLPYFDKLADFVDRHTLPDSGRLVAREGQTP